MVKLKTKKRKLVKESDNNNNNNKTIEKPKPKKKKIKQKPTTEKPISPTPQTSSSHSDNSTDSESDQIQKLLEPYTKQQLIDFIVDFAITNDSLSNRIREAAEKDVSHRKIFVHGLGWDTSKETLLAAFELYGEVEDCNVVTDRNSGKAKGFGFVLFKYRQGAIKALKEPRKKINNRMASCQLASIGPLSSNNVQSDTSGRKIYVSNVQSDVDPERLRVFFSKFGEIEIGPMGFDVVTGKSRGFALFVYKNQEGVKKVLEEPYKIFEGHQLHCQKAAEGKSNKGGNASITTALQPTPPVLAAVAAAQNMALFSQHPGLNPMYGGLFVNPLLASQVGTAAGTGIGGYAGIGGNQSVLGAYSGGSSGPILPVMGLQHAYPTSQVGQNSSARPQGASGSFSGHPSHF